MTPALLPFTPSIKRRAAALLAAVCVVVAQVEYLVPDEHDGDAAVTQLGAATDHSPTAPAGPSAPNPGHTVHLDHCAHAHVFASSVPAAEMNSPVSEASRPDTASPWLASVTAPPHSRPPIA